VIVNTDHPAVLDFFNAEYQYHRAMSPMAVTQTKQIPTLQLNFFQVGYHQGQVPEKFTAHVHKLLASWAYRIELDDSSIKIDAIGNRLAVPMIHHMLILPSLRYLSARQGVLLLHAGSVTLEGSSLILTGKGGAGKTTSTSLLLAEGGSSWKPHADDYVFLAPGKKTLAYISRSHLYRDILRWIPELRQRLTRSDRFRLEVFGRLREWSRDGIKWPVRLPVSSLWPDREVQMQARLSAFILLARNPSIQEPVLLPIRQDELPVQDLVTMNFYEARYFLQLLEKSHALPDITAWVNKWQAIETVLLRSCLSQIPVYQLSLPAQVTRPADLRRQVFIQLAGLLLPTLNEA